MASVASIFQQNQWNHYLGPAVVLALDALPERVRIRLESVPGRPETWARVLYPLSKTVVVGDEVLVGGDGMDDFFVVGLLSEPNSGTEIIKTKDGASATIERNSNRSEKEVIRVFSKKAALLFEYDPQAGTTRVSIPSGGLEIDAREGDIRLSSGRRIQLQAQDIEIEGLLGIKMKVAQIMDKLGSAISLTPGKAKIHTSHMQIVGQRGDIFIKQLRYLGSEFIAKTAHVQLLARKIETTAKTIVDKAENTYRTIKQLSYLKAGRKRTIVESTYHLKTRKANLKSDEDFKIKGEKIHLG